MVGAFKSALGSLTKTNLGADCLVKYYECREYLFGDVEKFEEKGNNLRATANASCRY